MPLEATTAAVESAGLLDAWRAMRELSLSKQGERRMARLWDEVRPRLGEEETGRRARWRRTSQTERSEARQGDQRGGAGRV